MTEEATGDDVDATDRERRLRQAREREELDANALERAHEDAHLVLEQALQLFSDLSDKAFRLIRLNGLVLTILVAIASQIPANRYVNVASAAVLLLFLGSALFALAAYLTTTVNRGLDETTFEKLLAYRLRHEEYLNLVLAHGYPKWIANGIEKVNRKELWVRRSLLAFIAGLVTLLVGILLALY